MAPASELQLANSVRLSIRSESLLRATRVYYTAGDWRWIAFLSFTFLAFSLLRSPYLDLASLNLT